MSSAAQFLLAQQQSNLGLHFWQSELPVYRSGGYCRQPINDHERVMVFSLFATTVILNMYFLFLNPCQAEDVFVNYFYQIIS